MKKLLVASMVIAIACLLTAGCTANEKQTAGVITGGVVGGVAGHALTGGSAVGTIAGTLGGAYVGKKVAE